MNSHKVEYRVYYEDTDAGGIVYHARYLHFAERGRTELLRSLGYENQRLQDELGLVFVAANMTIKFKKPARLDDLLSVETTIADVKNSSFTMNQKIRRGDIDIFEAECLLVCVENKAYRPVRVPLAIKEAFIKYQEPVK